MITIDRGVVERLLLTQLSTVSGVSVVPKGRAQPTADDAVWCRIVHLKLSRLERQKGSSEVERAALSLVVHVAAGPAAISASAYALGTALKAVAAAMSDRKLSDSPETVRVDLDGAETDEDPEPDPMRGLATGSVTVTGYVEGLA